MQFGIVLPGGSARQQLELARLADGIGWDGVFVWEAGYGVDAWTLLGAMAVQTTRVKLGTMLTPLPWRRPWKLASQAATVDRLSEGRAILAVGLGAVDDALGRYPEETDRKIRAELLDEGLDVLRSLWSGDLHHDGPRHHLDLRAAAGMYEHGGPHRPEGPPVWVVGAWPRPKSMQRIADKANGFLPNYVPAGEQASPDQNGFHPHHLAEALTWLREHGAKADLDAIVEGETPAGDADAGAEKVTPWRDAGATWWMEASWQPPDGVDPIEFVRARIAAGPPAST